MARCERTSGDLTRGDLDALRLLRRIDSMRERGEDPHLEVMPAEGHTKVRLQVRNLDLRARGPKLVGALARLEGAYRARTGQGRTG